MAMESGHQSGILHMLLKLAILVSATLVTTELLQSRSDLRQLRQMHSHDEPVLMRQMMMKNSDEPCPCQLQGGLDDDGGAHVQKAAVMAAVNAAHGKDNRAMLLDEVEDEPEYEIQDKHRQQQQEVVIEKEAENSATTVMENVAVESDTRVESESESESESETEGDASKESDSNDKGNADHNNNSDEQDILLDERFPCDISTFRRFYNTQWESMSGVPFTLSCLDKLIEENPTILSLRAALVRKKYSEKVHQSKRKIVYHCAEGSGGLGDRLWGSAFGLYMSLALNARFGIFFQEPVHYDTYLEPAGDDLPSIRNIFESMGDDWLPEYTASPKNPSFSLDQAVNKLQAGNGNSKYQVITSTRDTYTAMDFRSMPLGDHFFPDQVELSFLQLKQPPVIMLNTTAAIYDNPLIRSMRQEYRLEDMSPQQWLSIFVMLYAKKPTPFLRELERPLLEEINGRYVVGLQMRIGATDSGAIQWQDPVRYENVDPINCFIKAAKETCDRHESHADKASKRGGCVLLVTSDSSEAIARIQKAFRNTKIDVLEAGSQKITHIDKVGEDDKEANEDQRIVHSRAFSDWHLLAFATDRLLISRSGFGEVAALARPERPVLRLRDNSEFCRFASFVHCRYGDRDTDQVTPGFNETTHTVAHSSVVGLSLGAHKFAAS